MVQSTTPTSHEHESELFSEIEREVLNKNLVFSNLEQELAERITKHDLSIFLKLRDHGKGKFAMDNEALHGESITPMMVITVLHSFTPCIDSNNHLEGHDITSSHKVTSDSNTDQSTKRENHEFLKVEETHIGLISGNGKSPYSDMFEDQ